jgi:amidohydrolase
LNISKQINDLIKIRKTLHQFPEVSGNEKNTAQFIVDQLKPLQPDKIVDNIGGFGIAVIFDSKISGPTIAIRGDIDALPILETNTFEYKSQKPGVSHKCGHDGHTTILIGLAKLLSENKLKRGKVILIFQAAEETGEGAEKYINDNQFKDFKIDYVFALHNLPGFPLNSIVAKEETFASASKGLKINLLGKTSHAAEPENGISPANAISKLISQFHNLNMNKEYFKELTFLTIIHIRLGEIAFGTTPGYAEFLATLRSNSNEDIELLSKKCITILNEIAQAEDLKYKYEWTEEFPAVYNNSECVNKIKDIAEKNKYTIIELDEPFRWSEDYAHFTNKYKGALFGIGSGINHPQLHNPDYDFPDEILETGITMFWKIIQSIIK